MPALEITLQILSSVYDSAQESIPGMTKASHRGVGRGGRGWGHLNVEHGLGLSCSLRKCKLLSMSLSL